MFRCAGPDKNSIVHIRRGLPLICTPNLCDGKSDGAGSMVMASIPTVVGGDSYGRVLRVTAQYV